MSRRLTDAELVAQQIDVPPTEGQDLASSKLAPGGEKDDDPHPLRHRGGEGGDLGDARDRALGR